MSATITYTYVCDGVAVDQLGTQHAVGCDPVARVEWDLVETPPDMRQAIGLAGYVPAARSRHYSKACWAKRTELAARNGVTA